MRQSFPSEIDEKDFAAYFVDRILEESLERIAENFAVKIEGLHKDLFLQALCRRFKIIVHEKSDRDIIYDAYNDLLREYGKTGLF